jgi:hypothetical protein
MTFRQFLWLNSNQAPPGEQRDLKLISELLGPPADKEIADLTIRDIRAMAATINVPVEGMAAILTQKMCRVCGCTDDDCHQCIKKTGKACYWIADDLCSACLTTATGLPEPAKMIIEP